MSEWTREYFERGYAQRWGLPAPSDDVRLQAGGLFNLLQLSPASRVIDIGCGHGRHALALAELGPEERLYRVEELGAALEHAGFGIVGVFAGPDGATFEPTVSSAIWIAGQRSGAG